MLAGLVAVEGWWWQPIVYGLHSYAGHAAQSLICAHERMETWNLLFTFPWGWLRCYISNYSSHRSYFHILVLSFRMCIHLFCNLSICTLTARSGQRSHLFLYCISYSGQWHENKSKETRHQWKNNDHQNKNDTKVIPDFNGFPRVTLWRSNYDGLQWCDGETELP